MKIFFCFDDLSITPINGTIEQATTEALTKAKLEGHGFLGAIDSHGRLRATLDWRRYDKNAHTKVTQFIRKYKLREKMEHVAVCQKAHFLADVIENASPSD